MRLGKWVLGAVAAGLWFGSAQAAPFPVSQAPGVEAAGVESVQYYYGGPPRHGYYAPPRRRYAPPPPRYHGGYYQGPRHRYGYGYGYAPRRAAPPRYYTKDQVRAWNQMNGF